MSMPGFWEWAFLGVLALLIFGPDKLPGIARTIGRTLSQVRREAQGAVDELKRAAEVEELRKVGDELKQTAGEIEREAASARTVAAQQTAELREQAAARPAGSSPAAVAEGPPPFDPDAT